MMCLVRFDLGELCIGDVPPPPRRVRFKNIWTRQDVRRVLSATARTAGLSSGALAGIQQQHHRGEAWLVRRWTKRRPFYGTIRGRMPPVDYGFNLECGKP